MNTSAKVGATPTEKTKLQYREQICSLNGVFGALDANGNVLISTNENIIPTFDIRDGEPVVTYTNIYTIPMKFLLKKLHKIAGFTAYWESVKSSKDDNAVARFNASMLKSTDAIAEVLVSGANKKALSYTMDCVSEKTYVTSVKTENRIAYGALLENICFDIDIVPIAAIESFVDSDGIIDDFNEGDDRICIDLHIRLKPSFRATIEGFVKPTQDASDWK